MPSVGGKQTDKFLENIMSEHTINVTDENFDEKVLNSGEPVLVDFWAPWCGPCMTLGPTLDALAGEYQGKVTVAKMNVDENKNVPTNYGVRALPYLAVFKKGELVDSMAGAQPKARIASMLDKALV